MNSPNLATSYIEYLEISAAFSLEILKQFYATTGNERASMEYGISEDLFSFELIWKTGDRRQGFKKIYEKIDVALWLTSHKVLTASEFVADALKY